MAFGVAVVGLDHWYTAFAALDILTQSAIAPLVGVAEADPVRREAVAAKYPNAAVFADADALIARDDVRLVALCCSTDQAPDLARRALAAGKDVISVKPAARTLPELDAVIAAAASSGRFFGSFEGMQRLHPRALLLRDLVRSGAIGVPLSYQQRGHGGLPSPWPGQSGDPALGGGSWWIRANRVPGGAWIDHAIYAIDLARFVFGDSGLSVVGAQIEKRVRPDLELEDYGLALLRLQPDASVAPTPVSLVLEDTWAARPGGGTSRQEILGTDALLRMDSGAWVIAAGGKETRHEIPTAAFFPFETLAQQLERGETPPFGPADARAALAACLAVYAANR